MTLTPADRQHDIDVWRREVDKLAYSLKIDEQCERRVHGQPCPACQERARPTAARLVHARRRLAEAENAVYLDLPQTQPGVMTPETGTCATCKHLHHYDAEANIGRCSQWVSTVHGVPMYSVVHPIVAVDDRPAHGCRGWATPEPKKEMT